MKLKIKYSRDYNVKILTYRYLRKKTKSDKKKRKKDTQDL